jgi:hypothetical protein
LSSHSVAVGARETYRCVLEIEVGCCAEPTDKRYVALYESVECVALHLLDRGVICATVSEKFDTLSWSNTRTNSHTESTHAMTGSVIGDFRDNRAISSLKDAYRKGNNGKD